jgi:histidine phosphotransferase ChpT
VVDTIGEGPTIGFRVSATGTNARVPPAQALFNGTSEHPTIDAHTIQPYYAGLLAKECALTIKLAAEGDAIVVSAQQSVPAA